MKRIAYSLLTFILTLGLMLVLAACQPDQGVGTTDETAVVPDPQQELVPTPTAEIVVPVGAAPIFIIEITGAEQARFGSETTEAGDTGVYDYSYQQPARGVGQADHLEAVPTGLYDMTFTNDDATVQVNVRFSDTLSEGTYPVGVIDPDLRTEGGATDLDLVAATVELPDASYNLVTGGALTLSIPADGLVSGSFAFDLSHSGDDPNTITVNGSFENLPLPPPADALREITDDPPPSIGDEDQVQDPGPGS